MADKVETPNLEPALAQPETPESAPQPKDKRNAKPAEGTYLPVLVEFTFTFAVILLVLVFLAVAGLAWLGQDTWLGFVLRESVSIVTLGGLLLIIIRQIAIGTLSALQAEATEKAEKQAQAEQEKMENDTPTGQLEQLEKLPFPATQE